MRLDWVLSPITQYAFLALALVGCLVLFGSMKREIAILQHDLTLARDAASVSAASLVAQLATLRLERESAEPACFTGQELNLTRRAQALRMRRRGESSATIAGALRVPRNEIDLLLRIQELPHGRALERTRTLG